MADNLSKQFDRTYQSALAARLVRKPRSATTSRSARQIGKDAVILGLSAMDLARTHDQAMQLLEPIESSVVVEGTPPISLAAKFYIEALAPLEKSHQVEQAKSKRAEKRLERQLQKEIKRIEKLLAESHRQQGQVRYLTYQFLLGQEKERKEISHDLHDEIAQVLAGINVRLAALKKVAQIDRRDIGERIDQTQKLVEQSVAAVHRYAFRLRPSLLDDLGLVPSLRSYIKNLPGRKDLNIRFRADSKADFLSNEERTALYRVAQEALTNVVRHARAKKVSVRLRKLSDQIRLEVCDDGKSFNAMRILNSTSPRRFGLLGMRERVEMLGGTFSIESTPGKGTNVMADIPLTLASNKK